MKEKVIELNRIIDSLIEVAQSTCSCADETEKVRLDGQIRAYKEVKIHVEDILGEDDDTITKFLTFVHSKADEYYENANTGWGMADLIELSVVYGEQLKN